MTKYLFVYHGGSMPETEEETQRVMGQWQSWFGELGESVVDGGNPVGMSTTVHSDGSVTEDGGANPVSGYSLVNADNKEDAVTKASGCPILLVGGTVKVAEAIDIPM